MGKTKCVSADLLSTESVFWWTFSLSLDILLVCVVNKIYGLDVGPLSPGLVHHKRVIGNDHDGQIYNGNLTHHYMVYNKKICINNQILEFRL